MLDNTEDENYIDVTNSAGLVEVTNDDVAEGRPTGSGGLKINQWISVIEENKLVHVKNEVNDYVNSNIITKENSPQKLNEDLSVTKTEATYVGLNMVSNSRDSKFAHNINPSPLKKSAGDLYHKKREFESSVLNNPQSTKLPISLLS